MLKAVQTIHHLELKEKETISKSLHPCEQCEFSCITKQDLESHVNMSHKKEKCEKCLKEYSTSTQMRTHMWRSHESVECNNCVITVANRHDLKRHNKEEHRITKVQECKFYKEGGCVDSDECLFSHCHQEYSDILSGQSKN